MKKSKRTEKGFSLIEMMLVLVIVSTLVLMSLQYLQQKTLQQRIDKSAAQVQQILNAGLAYYVANSLATWPTSLAALQPAYLPATISAPWVGSTYSTAYTTTNFYVVLQLTGMSNAPAIARVIIGKLPLAYEATSAGTNGTAPTAGTCSGTSCYIAASVTIPGQNLNAVGAVTFAGLYHHGGCVPVPSCPVNSGGATLTAQIMVVPVSVSGMNDTGSSNVYPISSFTAYATGGTSASPPACNTATGSLTTCGSAGQISGGAPPSGKYWRACLQVITERGEVSTTTSSTPVSSSYPYNPWGGNVTLMAITRCAINNEPSGSNFTVFSQ